MWWVISRITEILWSWIEGVVDWLLSPLANLLESLENAFPIWQGNIEQFRYWLECVQPYLDLNTLSGLLVVWGGFYLAIILYRFAKSWIPAVSG